MSYYSEYQGKSKSLKFVESAEKLGIDFKHSGIYPPSRHENRQSYLNLISGVAPAIAVADINSDGFLDFYVTQPGLGALNQLYINQKGKGFREAAAEYGLADVNQKYYSQTPYFHDFDRDGDVDLLLMRYGCHSMYKNEEGIYREVNDALDSYCSNARGVSLVDYNRDGFVDIFVSNYFPQMDIYEKAPPWVHGVPGGDDIYGGHNHLLKGDGTGRFIRTADFDSEYKNHTFIAGVGDFNQDHWPDLFVGNDFSYDRMYLSREGRFEEVTDQFIPRARHGFAGMNSEVFDFDRDGRLDVYITNIYGPPFSRKGNILWRGGDGRFEDVSDLFSVRKCGWSWGAKFVDFDLDGEEELIVANGMVRGQNVSSVRDGEAFWYRRAQISATPRFLRKYTEGIHKGEDMNYFGYQRSCLFTRRGGAYVDVAKSAGLESFQNSRGLALIDFDNDGRIDVLMANQNGPLELFVNESRVGENRWLGIGLVGQNSDLPIGAKVKAYSEGKLIFFRELYPGNGHRGQNDPRMHIGLGSEQSIERVEVQWPNGPLGVYKNLEENRYNVLVFRNDQKNAFN